MVEKEKIALIVSGGGMKSAYCGGVVHGLSKKYPGFKPDIIISSSGGSGCASYYVTEQTDSGERIYKNLITSKRFISFLRPSKILDIDYLIDDIFKKQEPLNAKKLKKTEQKIFYAVTNYDTGDIDFVSHKEHDIFEILRAAKAMPFFYDKKIKLGDQSYIDGEITDNLMQKAISKAIEEGADKIIIVHTEGDTSLKSTFFQIYSTIFNPKLKKSLNRHEKDEIKESDAPILYLTPSKKLPFGLFNIDKNKISLAWDLGYNDVLSSQFIKEFINARGKLEMKNSLR